MNSDASKSTTMPAARARQAKAQTTGARNTSARQALKEKTNTTRPRQNPTQDIAGTDIATKDAKPAPRRLKRSAVFDAVEDGIDGDLRTENERAPSKIRRTRGPAKAPGTSAGNAHVDVGTLRSAQAVRRTSSRPSLGKENARQQHEQPVATVRQTPRTSGSTYLQSSNSLLRSRTKSTLQHSNNEMSDISLSNDLSLSLSLSPSPQKPHHRSSLAPNTSNTGVQSTPLIESSILALRNFKRRPRQPSILQMVQQRRASMLASVANSQIVGTGNESVFESEADDEEDDEIFSPQAEGTPVHIANKQGPGMAIEHSASEDELASDRISSGGLSRRRSRRKVSSSALQDEPSHTDVQVSASPAADELEDGTRHSIELMDPDVQIPSTENRETLHAEANQAPDWTMADPMSSSPVRESHPPGTQGTDIMADPVTQPSPPRLREKRTRQALKPVSTSTLQSLLPKRRKPKPRRHRTEYDIDLEDSDDGDVLSAPADEDQSSNRLPRRARLSKVPVFRRKSGGITAKPYAQSSRATAKPGRKAAATRSQPLSTKPVSRPPRRTYGRAGQSAETDETTPPPPDDKDSLLPDVSITMDEAEATSAELAAVKAKFAAVDEWEMEFDEMDVDEEHRSSSQMWR